ncbi:hypothetical protein WICANDRAFT_86061 [Wickerhamomyces anomalus NRRL Y-366-8]|uniref:Uncharacterized protein n=1 Tax=Wickerhamomyces anomalus (strain ATCC 58044 / CBS 1984 / NCYC 433 / NRRL Y-366-8) TaxID=683960 RepID=A0A1E3NVK7_WICAA|nr:uncharacterized protein WICANDRAFT_86061 [Wickerhamomyces anomalus NRRL Y-366-8]ODQ57143.1 hypothetical protein WICANDRAFT_86061 [Wickerhamomyces anomalus NRRL Y-366-8]
MYTARFRCVLGSQSETETERVKKLKSETETETEWYLGRGFKPYIDLYYRFDYDYIISYKYSQTE